MSTLRQKVELACSPHLRTEDWGYIMEVVDGINGSNTGPSEACALIIEQLQIGSEQVQRITLSLLQACVANCNRRFHDNIGKFKFLNELIKLVSPKYYSDVSPEVKKRILTMIQEWKNTLNQPKISEAYDMLRQQGHEFPIDAVSDAIPLNDNTFLEKKPKRRDSFDENEQQYMLRTLLQSKDPDDLAAANALIKNMVDPDEPEEDESSEKIKADLDTAQNNIDLFDEMLDSYNPSDGPLEDNDIMTELYQFLNKMRPRLKKLCQDMDEDEDVDGVIPVFRRVDNTLDKYEDIVDGKWDCSQGRADSPRKSNPSPDTRSPQAQQPNIDDLLLDLSDDTAMAAPPMQAQPAAGSILADDDFLSLSMGSGLGSGLSAISPTPGAQTDSKYSALSDLDQLASLNFSNTMAADPAPLSMSANPTTTEMSPHLLSGGSLTPMAPADLSTVSMELSAFKPAKQPPTTVYDQNGLRVLIHRAQDTIQPNTQPYNISFMNQNGAEITPFSFLAAVPKVMQVKFQAPSSSTLPPFDMIMGPKMVSQIMFIHNPQNAPVKLKFKLTFSYEGQEYTEQGLLSL